MNKESYAIQYVALVDMLRRGPAHSVEILTDNEEGNGPDNCAVEACGDWTGYANKRFYGHTVLDALQAAVVAMQEAQKQPLPSPFVQVIPMEHIRIGLQRIKELASLRDPPYDLPADSMIEAAVFDILTRTNRA